MSVRFAGSKINDYLGQGPNFGDMYRSASKARTSQSIANMSADAEVANAGITGVARMRGAEAEAKAIAAGAAAQASATRAQGFGNMLGGIAGGISQMDFGGRGGNGLGNYNGTDFGTFAGSGTGSISGYTSKFNGSSLFN